MRQNSSNCSRETGYRKCAMHPRSLRGTLIPEGGTAHWLLARSRMGRNAMPIGCMAS